MQRAGTARVQIVGLTPKEAKAEQAETLASNTNDVK
jgi:rare lipoprotein A